MTPHTLLGHDPRTPCCALDIADQTLTHTAAPTAQHPVLSESVGSSRSRAKAKRQKGVSVPVVMDARVVTGSGGGPDKTILNSPRFLEPLGYRMVCAYMHPPEDPGFEGLRQKAARYRAPLVSIPDRGPWDWRVFSQTLAACRREKVSIWHGHDYKTNALGLLLRRFWPMKLVTTVHGWVQHTARTPLYYRIDQMCLPRYEKVICVSDDLLESCLECGVATRDIVLLENAIDTSEYTRQLAIKAAKAKLGIPTDGFLIGSVGRLAAEKAFDVQIRSVRELLNRGHDVRLVIVGEGDQRQELERVAESLGVADRVLLPGWQSDVRTYYEAMDLFALSSLREGLPNVLLEAMALEVPIVSTCVNGIPRLIQDGRNGLLVRSGDQEGFTRALLAVLANDGLANLFRCAGRRTVEGRYSFQTRMEKLKRIYDELLAE